MLEAMAVTKPIVASNVGDICEIFKGGETGILIPPRDSSEIAASVNYLLHNPDYALRIGRGGLKEIQKRGLIYEKSIKRLEAIYMSQISVQPKHSFTKKLLRKLYLYGVCMVIPLGLSVYKILDYVYTKGIVYKKESKKRHL
jgi:hypothetical protein